MKVGLYISFFPQLIASPIVKYGRWPADRPPQREPGRTSPPGAAGSSWAWARRLLCPATGRGGRPGLWPGDGLSASFAWLSALCYTRRSTTISPLIDMAIGAARCSLPLPGEQLPLHLPVHHRILAAVAHLPCPPGLGLCLFPLGLARWTQVKHRNLFVVWLLTGIWHQGQLNVLAWGLFFVLVLEKYGHLGRGCGNGPNGCLPS